MDKSYLSQPDVVAASRKFVCIRLLTYESAEEAEVIKGFFIGRSGELENTIFAILSPDAKKKLVEAGRSPNQVFPGDPQASRQAMVKAMEKAAAQYTGSKDESVTPAPLPLHADLRLALDAAACDDLPLAVVCSTKEDLRRGLEKAVAAQSWTPDFVGLFTYASVSDASELKPIAGVKDGGGLLLIQPDPYGQSGKVLVQLGEKPSEAELKKAMNEALRLHKPADKSDPPGFIRAGQHKGVVWKTAIPDTDPGPGRRPQ